MIFFWLLSIAFPSFADSESFNDRPWSKNGALCKEAELDIKKWNDKPSAGKHFSPEQLNRTLGFLENLPTATIEERNSIWVAPPVLDSSKWDQKKTEIAQRGCAPERLTIIDGLIDYSKDKKLTAELKNRISVAFKKSFQRPALPHIAILIAESGQLRNAVSAGILILPADQIVALNNFISDVQSLTEATNNKLTPLREKDKKTFQDWARAGFDESVENREKILKQSSAIQAYVKAVIELHNAEKRLAYRYSEIVRKLSFSNQN